MCERSQKLLLLNLLAHVEWECQMGVIQAVHRHDWCLGISFSALPHQCWNKVGIILKLKTDSAKKGNTYCFLSVEIC